jgi:hypothetical protein
MLSYVRKFVDPDSANSDHGKCDFMKLMTPSTDLLLQSCVVLVSDQEGLFAVSSN